MDTLITKELFPEQIVFGLGKNLMNRRRRLIVEGKSDG